MPYVDVSFSHNSIDDMINLINDIIDEFVANHTIKVTGAQIGLDHRAGYNIHIVDYNGESGIMCSISNNGALRYYGGFEYVGSEHIKTIGNYVFYSEEANRVKACLEHFKLNRLQKIEAKVVNE